MDDSYVEDTMVQSGGGHNYIHAKRLTREHPLYEKFIDFRWNPSKYTGKRRLVVTTATYNWITSGREIKKGQRIYHLDGDNLNDDLDNLIALPVAEGMLLCSFLKKLDYKKVNPEIIDIYLRYIRLKIKIGERINDREIGSDDRN